MDADRIAAWHDQFAPPAPTKDVQPVDVAARSATVEHPAGEDGVFAVPVAVEAEPVVDEVADGFKAMSQAADASA